jgi:hypothetical protein
VALVHGYFQMNLAIYFINESHSQASSGKFSEILPTFRQGNSAKRDYY